MGTLQLLSDAVTLTGSAVASTQVAQTHGYDQHTLYIEYTPGQDATNALTVTIEMSPDGVKWFPYTGAYSAATGTATPGTQVTLSFDSAGVAAQKHAPYFFNGAAFQIRIKASETNTPSPFGTYSAWLFSTHS